MIRPGGLLKSFLALCLATFPLIAHGATTDFRVLFDEDNNTATGCDVAGLAGVDQVLLTRVEVGESAAHVTGTFRQVCSGGVLGAPIALEVSGWNAGFTPLSGALLVETRMPFSAFDGSMRKMRIGIDAHQGSLTHVALALPPDEPVYFPIPARSRRRAVAAPGEDRMIQLDGVAADWTGLTTKFDGIGSGGTAGLRMIRLLAFSNTNDNFLYFLFDSNVSANAPFAQDDQYTRNAGQNLTVPGLTGEPTVLDNDTDPNGTPLKAKLVSQPAGGEVVLDETGGFTYTPDDPSSLQPDSFDYRAFHGDIDSNVATVTISVETAEVNAPPVFTSSAAPVVPEGAVSVVNVTATDAEGDPVTFAITGGADQARFTLTAGNELRFSAPPDFEGPASAGGGNTYFVVVTAFDGHGGEADQTIVVTVSNVDEPPFFTSGSSAFNVPENTTAITTITATDPDGTPMVYTIGGGADASRVTINSATGALTFITAPNFEIPTDAGTNNVYNFNVSATDGNGSAVQLAITVTVMPVNEAPTFTSTATPSVAENTSAVVTVATVDQEGQTVTYALTGGADQGDFSINTSTGALTFTASPNFEAPADANTDNVYNVQVTATDGTNAVVQFLTVTVTNVNETPSFTSSNAATIPENTLAAMTVTTSDPDADAITYTVTGGADQALFTIDLNSGALAFNAAPNYEAPADADTNNQYVVQVTATDGTNSINQTITITVTDVNEAPVFTSGNTPSVVEGITAVTTVTTTDQEGNTVTYSLTGGADQALFSIDTNSGALTFNAAPNFEAPADADTNNVYLVQVTATDGTNPVVQNLSVTVTDLNEAPVFTSSASPSIPENTTAVLTTTTTDPENNTVTYTITGGSDQARFSITGAGVLTFNVAPNFEAPTDSDTNNTYQVQITANDGTNNTNQTITVTVTDVNEAPVFSSANTASVPENTTAVTTVTTTDQEGNAVTYTITGGADAAKFAVGLNSGALTFLVAPNYDIAGDANADNQYIVQVTANDGTNNTNQTITVTVTDVNEAPSFTSGTAPSVPENTTAVTTVTTIDPENNSITYTVTGGADMALFSVGLNSGALTFNAAPNYEAPADADTNNVYDVQVTATDGVNPVVQTLTVTVTDVNETPSFTSTNTASVPENTTAVTTVTTSDPEGNTVTYTVTGGADAAKFAVNLNSGALTFLVAPNFDIAGDANADNQYIVQVTANDGTNTINQTITVTVTDVNEAPSFTSGNSPSVAENTTAVTTVTTTDPESNSITYTVTGGADMALFSVGLNSGVLTFNAAPNFELPGDAGANNVYDVQVTATDGTNPVVQTLTVTVTNVNEGPTFNSGFGTVNSPENSTVVTTLTTTDPEGQTVTYTITGGVDMGLFSVDTNSGVLSFLVAPDYEAPTDADANNQYAVEITATDGTTPAVQTMIITVTDVNEAPAFTSSATPTVVENDTTVITVTTTDPESNTVTYTVTGGVDMALFGIDLNTGELRFLSAPDFEAPADAGANNVYDVQVTANDGTNNSVQTLAVTVTNANDPPVFTSAGTFNVPENTAAVGTVTTTDQEGATISYTITGGADMALFSIGLNSGALTFNAAPNFEAPADAGANNVYDIEVTATDGTNPITQNIAVTVTNVNEAPSFTSANSASVPENTTAITTVSTTDPELQTVTYTITGGADQAFFSVDLNSGVLTFLTPRNFEAPADAGNNNTYVVEITATDGTNPVVQTFTATVTNVNEGPAFTSTATPSVPENTTAAVTVTAPDPESSPVSYTITGGADQLLFSIGLSSGALTFNTAPNFEAPADAGANNVYDVQVTATDGSIPAVQNIAVTVTNVNEAPSITSSNNATVAENITTVTTVTTTDPEGQTVTYTVTGGADMALFSIGLNSGVLTFNAPPNYEAPADAGANSIYDVQITATDGTNPVNQTITVTVTDVNEGPEYTSSPAFSIPENSTAVGNVVAVDPEGLAVTYTLTGGADIALFNLTTGGVLTFISAPNFEVPTDAGTNNVYNIQVTATDGTNPNVQNIAVTVTNVNEAPVNAVPPGQTFAEDVNRVFSSGNSNLISISDVDAGASAVQVTLTATNGTLSTNGTTGLTFTLPADGVDDVTMTFTGTITNINARLDGLTYKPNANYYGGAQITIVTDDLGNTGSGGAQSDSDNIALTITPVNDPPTATVKTHTTHSGIGLTISAATHTGELKEGAADVDDHDPFSELTVQIVGGSVTPTGSTLNLIDASDGSFYYEPRGGVSGAGTGSFQFQVCDNGDVGLGLAAQCSTATTVTFNMTGPDLWFIDDTDAAGCGVNCNGSRTKPLVGLNTANANFVARGTGDRIFAFSGTYNHGHTFAASEQLTGQASSGAFDAVLGVSTPANGTLDTRPSLSGAAATLQNVVTAATSSSMRGIAIASTANGYVGTAASSLTVLESSVSAAGRAVDLTGALTSSVSFTSTSSAGGTLGINLDNVSGTFAFGSGGLSGNTTAAFALKNSNNSTITYAGNLAPGGAGRAVLIGTSDGNSGVNASTGLEAGATVTLSGNITTGGIAAYESSGGTLHLTSATQTFSTGAVNGVELIDNNSTTFNFSGTNLNITTTTGTAFHASQGGIVNVTGANNVIDANGGIGLEVVGTASETMGGTHTWRSISSDGNNTADWGIHVTHYTGPFTVSGDGPDGDTLPDSLTSGGTIEEIEDRGAEFSNVSGAISLNGMTFLNAAATNGAAVSLCGLPVTGDTTQCNAAIHLVNATTSTGLRSIFVNGSVQHGINANNVTNLTMTDVEVTGAGNETDESGVMLTNVKGSGSITNGNFHDNHARALHLTGTSGTLTAFPIKGTTFEGSPNNQGLLVEMHNAGTSANVAVGGSGGDACTFANTFGNGFEANSSSNSSLTFSVAGSSITNTNGVVGANAASGGNVISTLTGNTFIAGANTGAGVISLASSNGGTMTVDVLGNTIGSAVAGSGTACVSCNGMFINPHSTGASDIEIRGNIIQHVNGGGIIYRVGNVAANYNHKLTITGNVIRDPEASAATSSLAVEIRNGITAGSSPPSTHDSGCLALTLGGATNYGGAASTNADAMNIFEDSWNGSSADIFLFTRFATTTKMPSYAPTFDSYVRARNVVPTAPTQTVSSLHQDTSTAVAGASCP